MKLPTGSPFFLFAAALASLALIAACGDEESSEEQRWTSELSSQGTTLHQVGTDGRVVYGWNNLHGQTTFDGEPAEVELLGNVAYENGSGPFFGFLTLTFSDGSIGMRMVGEAKAGTDTSHAEFTSTLTVLGGTGRYVNVGGSGEWKGSRDARLGGQVHMEGTLKLARH